MNRVQGNLDVPVHLMRAATHFDKSSPLPDIEDVKSLILKRSSSCGSAPCGYMCSANALEASPESEGFHSLPAG